MPRPRGRNEQDLYDRLYATALPVGTFDGAAWSTDVPGVWFMNRIWQGKHFDGARVSNRILGHTAITGDVTLEEGTVLIRYRHGLTDRLRPVNADRWLGQMTVFGRVIWFELTRE